MHTFQLSEIQLLMSVQSIKADLTYSIYNITLIFLNLEMEAPVPMVALFNIATKFCSASIKLQCHINMSQSQLFPPDPAAELQTADFLSSIFIDWLSERDIVDKTAFPVFIPFDMGIRVAVERDDCTSVPCWKKGKEKLEITFLWTMCLSL